MKSMQQMEAMQQIRPPQSSRWKIHSGRVALFLGLFFGVGSGIIDTIYAFVVVHKHVLLREDIGPYLWPENINKPYFNVFWTFLYNIPIYILLFLIFFLVGFVTTSLTRNLSKHVAVTIWTGVSFLVLHCFLATYLVFSEGIYGQLGEASTPIVARGVLIPAILYSVVAVLILTVLGLGLSRLGGLLARASFSRAESPSEPLPRF
ncbi:MAG TPA: hypothetical protein VFN35_29560 [Ktedonobacteraceae bacterium]|nr:hypothetical protein [Ktedonobacteraceae bacterium]